VFGDRVINKVNMLNLAETENKVRGSGESASNCGWW
jgi:hypothetical protein